MTADEYIAQRKAMRAQGMLPQNNLTFTNNYADLLEPQVPQESQGWLADLLGGIVNPFVNLGKMGLEGLTKGISAIGGQDMSSYKPIFMKPSEYYGVQERPVQTALGAGATLGSLLIPGAAAGAGIPAIAGRGALSGALFGGGQELMRPESTPGSILTSAGTGGLLGGALAGTLGVGGKFIKSLKSPAKQFEAKTMADEALLQNQPRLAKLTSAEKVKLETIASPYTDMIKESSPFVRQSDVMQVMSDVTKFNKGQEVLPGVKVPSGVKTGTAGKLGMIEPKKLEETMQLIADNTRKTVDKMAGNIKGTYITKTELKDLLKETFATSEKTVRDRMRQITNPILKGFDNNLTFSDVENVAGQVIEKASGAGKRIFNETLPTGTQEVGLTASKMFRDLYKTRADTANFLPYFDLMNTYNTVKPGVFKYSTTSPTMWTLNMPIPTKLVSVPLRNAYGAIKGEATKVGGGFRSTPTPFIPSQVGLIPGVLGGMQRQQPALPLSTTGTETTTGTTGMTGGMGNVQGQQQILAMLAAGMKPSDVKIIADLLGFSPSTTATKGLSNNQVNAKQGLKDLATIKSIIAKTGNLPLITPYFLKTSEGKQLETAIASVADIIARNRTGAAINEQELEEYRNLLPRFTDDPATIQSKLSRLEGIFSDVLNNVGTSTSTDQLTNQIQTILGQ